jgi:hypothetical protein
MGEVLKFFSLTKEPREGVIPFHLVAETFRSPQSTLLARHLLQRGEPPQRSGSSSPVAVGASSPYEGGLGEVKYIKLFVKWYKVFIRVFLTNALQRAKHLP